MSSMVITVVVEQKVSLWSPRQSASRIPPEVLDQNSQPDRRFAISMLSNETEFAMGNNGDVLIINWIG